MTELENVGGANEVRLDTNRRDEHGLPWYWNGKHYLPKCIICGYYVVDIQCISNNICNNCRYEMSNEKDMCCSECGKMYNKKDMYNNFICLNCYKEATT